MANLKLRQDADTSVSTGLTTNQVNILPEVGFIMPFLGLSTSIPSGWVLCNGSSSTPDLRGKFIYGSTSLGAVTGAHSHTPTHTVSSVNSDNGGAHTSTFNTALSIPVNTDTHVHTISASRRSGPQINDGQNANRVSGTQANVIANDHYHNVYPTDTATSTAILSTAQDHTHTVSTSSAGAAVWDATHSHTKTGSSSNITGTTVSGIPAKLTINFIMYVGI